MRITLPAGFIKFLPLLILIFISGTFISTRVSAEIQPQTECEQEWCVCEGYTPQMLRTDEDNATYDWVGDPISSECFKWFHIWRKYNNSDPEQFLEMAQQSCDNCRVEQPVNIPTETPIPETEYAPEEPDLDEPYSEELQPCEPFKDSGDMDCDGIPDDEDLCRATPGTQDHCGCGTIIAGDLVFRAGLASWATTGPVGDFDFGHVGMYTGDILVDSYYRNPHPSGTTVLKYDPEQERFVKSSYNDSYFYDNAIVVDSIIEADGNESLDGAYVSNIANLVASHNQWSGATSDNLAFGRNPSMTCSQRREAVQKMMYLTQLTEQGLEYSLINGANCANYVLEAYRSALGDNYLKSIDSNDYNYLWPLSPNYLSMHLDLYNFDGKNVYQAGDAFKSDNPVITIHSNLGGTGFRNQTSPTDHNISWKINAPVREDSDKPLLTVYDDAGNTSGETSAGVVAEIPGSEVFSHDGLPTVINVVGQDALLIQVNVGSPAEFELMIRAENYPSPGQTITILYPKTPLESDAEFQVELIPTALDPDSLAMYIYRDGADNSEESIIPSVETGEMEATSLESQTDDQYFFEEPSGSEWQDSGSGRILWLVIPGILFLGVSLVVLMIGLFSKSKALIIVGLVLTALVVCVVVAAAVYFFWLA